MKRVRNPRLQKALEASGEAKESYEQVRAETQLNCEHPIEHCVEAPYSSYAFWNSSSTQPPFRVCKVCGYAEEGWGCGYIFLHPKVTYGKLGEIPRKEALKFKLGKLHGSSFAYAAKLGRVSMKEFLS